MHKEPMKTHFAPAERAGQEQVLREADRVTNSPIVDGVLRLSSGLIAVLNAERQILATNTSLLQALGCRDAVEVLGLRMGEALQCVHAGETEGGCGTTEFCATCGAAIAIVSALNTDSPVERTCALLTQRAGVETYLFFRVRAVPVIVADTKLLLVFLHDITKQQQWAAIERLFFHDIGNVITGLEGSCAALAAAAPEDLSAIAKEALRMSNRLAREISIQRALFATGASTYEPVLQTVTIARIAEDVRTMFARHRAAQGKTLTAAHTPSGRMLETDPTLVLRVLGNMIVNALEATGPGGAVRLSIEENPEWVTFSVWNDATIPTAIQKRIFQRNFSTTDDMGRGLGTYSMKLFGEQVLGGRVSFTSDASGTVFRFSLPTVSVR